jgi:single-strand DNA-binding protein
VSAFQFSGDSGKLRERTFFPGPPGPLFLTFDPENLSLGGETPMANFNKVLLIGNLTRDIEIRSTQGGTQVAKFGMAINRKWTGANGQSSESTCFVDCTAFGKQADILAKYVRRGSPLFVEGRLDFSTWTAQDGSKRSKLAVVVENFQFLGAGQGAGQGAGGRSGGQQAGNQGGGGGNYGAEPDMGDYGDGGYGAGGMEAGEVPF